MPSIVVQYVETTYPNPNGVGVQTILGTETLTDIVETLLPKSAQHPVVFVKRFAVSNNHRWFVENVQPTPAAAGNPTSFSVQLSKAILPVKEEHLSETLQKTTRPVNKILWPGVLVEVDYGFIQSIGHSNGSILENHQYPDTVQRGEMHKRRLAIVNKLFDARVQVVPVTSQAQSTADRTAFELSPDSLRELSFYGANGKPSWVVCNMLQTVSFRRILPPTSFYVERGATKKGRNTRYGVEITKGDLRALRKAMAHTVGVRDYEQSLLQEHELAGAQAQLETQARLLHDREQELETLRAIAAVARDWSEGMGGPQVLQDELNRRRGGA